MLSQLNYAQVLVVGLEPTAFGLRDRYSCQIELHKQSIIACVVYDTYRTKFYKGVTQA